MFGWIFSIIFFKFNIAHCSECTQAEHVYEKQEQEILRLKQEVEEKRAQVELCEESMFHMSKLEGERKRIQAKKILKSTCPDAIVYYYMRINRFDSFYLSRLRKSLCIRSVHDGASGKGTYRCSLAEIITTTTSNSLCESLCCFSKWMCS